MTDLFQALTVEQARRELTAHLRLPARTEEVPLPLAAGRLLAAPVRVQDDIPGFARSTVDGFAVRAADTFGASEGLPAYLDLDGEILMGQEAVRPLKPGTAQRIPTGGMLPPGADAVVMVEYSEPLDERTIGVVRPVAPGENVVQRGEDMAAGQVVLEPGRSLRPQELGLLAALGLGRVPVLARPRVGIVSTGDEVVPPETMPAPGQVRDINSYALAGQVEQAGGQAQLYGIVCDSAAALQEVLEKALSECELVLLSGGSSVGTRDVSAAVLERLGRPGVLFHGLAIKPGKPTIGAVVEGKAVFGLPGHPVSAMVVFLLLVEPLLRRGRYPQTETERQAEFPLPAEITRNMRSAAGREDFIRVRLDYQQGRWLAHPVLGKSGLISTMVQADALAWITAAREGVVAGETVPVRPLGPGGFGS
ncbi:molybdopterin molybdotransferase MoeA [Desulfurispora thermophila]|uniref:molybdopterin molybdotransferase MoeA n=1 Tax=Desulfurispora thermophila TaxID=265470 RepID=UPI0003666180|nr:gephyrin-like molybdotransferase Glp [Desulfurispora thermophila]